MPSTAVLESTFLSSSVQHDRESLNKKVIENPSNPASSSSNASFSLPRSLRHEVNITSRLLRSNAVGFLFIFMGAAFARIIRVPLSWIENVLAIIESLILTVVISYIFDICNQTTAPDEDYVNKPHRPIPAGLITMKEANTRRILSWALTPLALWKTAGFWAMIHLWSWELLITFCYIWPRWFSWFMRNFFASYSYCILARLVNQVLMRYGGEAWNIPWTIGYSIFVWFMGSIHIQEFYDLEGDRQSDRKTLPMLLSPRGLEVLRAATSTFLVAFALGLACCGYLKMSQDTLTGPMSLFQLVLSLHLAHRVVALDSPEMDRRTYHTYYYPTVLCILFTLVLVTPD